jgi:hypothetical protein
MSLTSDEYANKNWSKCPNCESARTTAGNTTDADANWLLMRVECSACGATWEDSYELVGYRNLES